MFNEDNNTPLSFTSFKDDVRANRNKSLSSMVITFEAAEEIIQPAVAAEIQKEIKEEKENEKNLVLNKNRDKQYLKQREEKFAHLISDVIAENKITVAGYENNKAELVKVLTANFIGYGAVDEAMKNPRVSDIYIMSYDNIFIEEDGVNKPYPHHFKSPEDLSNFIDRMAQQASTSVDYSKHKISDFELYENRYCGISDAVTPDSKSLTIRKHPEEHITFQQIREAGILTDEMSDFIKTLIKGGRNIIYAGLTGSGKTTTIRAALEEAVPGLNRRIVSCEDTPELYLTNPNTLRMVTSPSEKEEENKSLIDLIYATLRLKPWYIIIGEIRDEAAVAAVEAMETGHSTIFTMHGGTPMNCINRLVNKYLSKMPALGVEVTERIIGSAVDYIMVQDNIPNIGRKIVTIDEVSYDYEARTTKLKHIYRYDIEKREFLKVGDISEDKAWLMMRRGVSKEELRPWYKGESEA